MTSPSIRDPVNNDLLTAKLAARIAPAMLFACSAILWLVAPH
ncbi:MAG: hypothetical protein WB789_03640 [Thermoplasmata archaeon]